MKAVPTLFCWIPAQLRGEETLEKLCSCWQWSMPLSDMQQKYHYLFIDIINPVELLLTLSSYGFKTNVTTWLYFFFFSKYICNLILCCCCHCFLFSCPGSSSPSSSCFICLKISSCSLFSQGIGEMTEKMCSTVNEGRMAAYLSRVKCWLNQHHFQQPKHLLSYLAGHDLYR